MTDDTPPPKKPGGGNRVFTGEEMLGAFGEHPRASWRYVPPKKIRGVPWYKQSGEGRQTVDEEELDRAADMLRHTGEHDGEPMIPWADLPEFQKEYFREIVRGNAGASLG